MAKTNPIGVRFDEGLLNKLKEASLADSPQKALNLYERSYLELIKMKVNENNKPENKDRILKERWKGSPIIISSATPASYDGERVNPLISDEMGQWEPINEESLEAMAKISALELENSKLGVGPLADKLRKVNNAKIKSLKDKVK